MINVLTCKRGQSGFESSEPEREGYVTPGLYYYVTTILVLSLDSATGHSAFSPPRL